MSQVIDFLSEYIYVYIWLIFTTYINLLAPMPGSVVVNPVTAYFTDPHRAIGIGALTFFCTGLHRVYIFRKSVFEDKNNIKYLKSMLPPSIFGAILGGSIIAYLNVKVLVSIIVVASVYFAYKNLKQILGNYKSDKSPSKLGQLFVSFLSGILQGSGMPGSDIRNNYLRLHLKETSLRGVTSIIGLVNFFIAGSIIYIHNQLNNKDLIFIATVVPILYLVQHKAKVHLEKMSDRNAKLLAVGFSIFGSVLISIKYIL